MNRVLITLVLVFLCVVNAIAQDRYVLVDDSPNTNVNVSDKKVKSSSSKENRTSVFEIGYSTTSFSEIKHDGSYGISYTVLVWEMVKNFSLGFHISPFNFNYGLVDKEYASDCVYLGPTIAYFITPKVFLTMPLDVMCDVFFDSNNDDKAKLSWGIALSPTIYFGNKMGVYLGPQLSVGFSGGSTANIGFRAGLFF